MQSPGIREYKRLEQEKEIQMQDNLKALELKLNYKQARREARIAFIRESWPYIILVIFILCITTCLVIDTAHKR